MSYWSGGKSYRKDKKKGKWVPNIQKYEDPYHKGETRPFLPSKTNRVFRHGHIAVGGPVKIIKRGE